jgi:hypothetical protein
MGIKTHERINLMETKTYERISLMETKTYERISLNRIFIDIYCCHYALFILWCTAAICPALCIEF